MSTQPTNIDFTPHHRPPVESGEYDIAVKQTISGGGIDTAYGSEGTTPLAATYRFFVAGERFSIAPKEIHSVFPPDQNVGQHTNVLPHILINRTTLPWEREGVPGDANTPWMALLVVHENEYADAVSTTVALSELVAGSTSAAPYFPPLTLEPGQQADDRVAVLDIKKSLLEQQLPTKADLNWLAHIRQGTDGSGNVVGEEMAALVAKRLPAANAKNTVYLVALENRYTAGTDSFNYQGAGTDDAIRLVNLYQWQFYNEDTLGDFATILKSLNRATGRAATDAYLASGFFPVPHAMRQGTQTVSWYHGPLAPQANTETFAFPAKSADALLRYYEADAMFDTSYAAAWELGRLLGLQNNRYATALYRWKREYAQALSKQQQTTTEDTGHLKGGNQDNSTPPIPDSVTEWLTALELLNGVPFNYLVPDEQLLPTESIRFFEVDSLWMQALQDGALSPGRVTTKDHALDQAIVAEEDLLTSATVSGFLLRSEAVKGWPGMQVEAFSGTPNPEGQVTGPLTLLRRDTLGNNVMLCLFTGKLQTLDLHLKPEVLHFGVTEATSGSFTKKLRDNEGVEQDDFEITVPANGHRVVDVPALVANIQAEYNANNSVKWNASPTSATLALQLIEGVERVRFTTA